MNKIPSFDEEYVIPMFFIGTDNIAYFVKHLATESKTGVSG